MPHQHRFSVDVSQTTPYLLYRLYYHHPKRFITESSLWMCPKLHTLFTIFTIQATCTLTIINVHHYQSTGEVSQTTYSIHYIGHILLQMPYCHPPQGLCPKPHSIYYVCHINTLKNAIPSEVHYRCIPNHTLFTTKTTTSTWLT